MVSHTAYLEQLDSLSTSSPEWPVVAAGFVVLRLVDAWLREGADVIRRDRSAIEAVRQAISKLSSSDHIRPLLSEVVDIIEQSEIKALQWVSPYLWRYGVILDHEGQWACAYDVFRTMRQHADGEGDHWLTMQSAMYAGPLARYVVDLNAADTEFVIADQAAKRIDHTEGRLRARLGLAKNLMTRQGNATQAIAIVHGILEEAVLEGSPNFVGRVLTNLGYLSFVQRDHSAAIQFNKASLRFLDDPYDIERTKMNSAASLVCLGDIRAARQLYLSVLKDSREEHMRQNTLINLLELAARTGDRPLFERYRQEILSTPLLVCSQAAFHLFSGQGFQVFGQHAAAQEELHHALAIALDYHSTDLISAIQSNLGGLERPTSTVLSGY